MNTNQAEAEAANALVDYALTLVKSYIEHPGDIDAAMTAVFIVALEKVLNKEIYVEQLYT